MLEKSQLKCTCLRWLVNGCLWGERNPVMVTAVKYILCRELVKSHASTDASGILMLQRWEPWCLLWLLLLLLTTIKTGVKSGFKYCNKTVSAHFTCSKHAGFYCCLVFLCWFSSLYNNHVSDIFLWGILLPLFFVSPKRRALLIMISGNVSIRYVATEGLTLPRRRFLLLPETSLEYS